MKKRSKPPTKEQDADYYLRLRIPPKLKRRLKLIASRRAVGVGSRPVSVSDVSREYLIEGAQKEKAV